MTPASYRRFKWGVAGRCAAAGAGAALVSLSRSPDAAAALAIGCACGIANSLLIMQGSERLVKTGSPTLFGLSSLLRLAGFSIVAAALAAHGPWWSLGPFLAGFLFPLAAYAWAASRAFRHTDR